jgi:hypothetical protein
LNKFGLFNDDETRGFNAWVNSKIGSIRAQISVLADIKTRQEETESALVQARLAKKYAEERPKVDAMLAIIGGLATPGKVPAERNGYAALTDADRETVAYANWKKELTLRTNMRDDARKAFAQRSEDGYSVDALDAHARGEATVVMGTLVRIGSFVENGDTLLVVRTGRHRQAGNLYGYNPADQSDIELLKLAKPVFTDKGAARWRTLVDMAARLDEATIASPDFGGAYGATDPRLYMSMVEDVRDAIKVAVPAAPMSKSSFSFKRPYFPIVLDELTEDSGGALAKRIRAEQVELLDLSRGSSWNVVVRDTRNVAPSLDINVRTQAEAIREYAVAHGLRATEDDLQAINSGLYVRNVVDQLGLRALFFKTLPEGVAASKTADALDAWALDWFRAQLDWLDVADLQSALGSYLSQYMREQAKVDDGSERWVKIIDTPTYLLRDVVLAAVETAIKGGLLVDEIVAENGGNSYPMPYIPAGFMAEGAGRKIAEVLCESVGDYIELKVGADKLRASNGYGPNVRLYYANWGDAVSLVAALFSDRWKSLVQWAQSVERVRAADKAGVDVPGILATLNATDGVMSAEVGDKDVTEKTSLGTVNFKSGTYLNVKLVYKGAVSNKVSFSDTPLNGRVYSKLDKTWRFPLESLKSLSGKDVASVEDLFKHIGLDFSQYRA